MSRSIPYGRQHITESDIQAVVETLKSDFLTQGPKVSEFEQAFANYIGANHALAISNGTAALHLATMALGVKPGDKVITTPLTFAASANCVRYCGGEVVFADIDPETYLLDINEVRKLIEKSPKGTYKGIIPVDFAGRCVNMELFRELADEFGLWIIEDACHAPGAYFTDSSGTKQKAGNGSFADISVFSFHPVKHIAMGEGGAITTNNDELAKKIQLLRTHGIHRNASEYENSISFAGGEDSYPIWYMEMHDLGYNYRLTDFQAALGISQLSRAEAGLKRRIQIAEKYTNTFKNKNYIKSISGLVEGHAYHLYVLEVENRLDLYNYLRSKNIFAQIHYIPCHLMPYYKKLGWKEGDLPKVEAYYRDCISIPMYPSLEDEEIEYVIQTIDQFYHG